MGYRIDRQELLVLTAIIVGASLAAYLFNLYQWIFVTAMEVAAYHWAIPFLFLSALTASLITIFKKFEMRLLPITIAISFGIFYNAVLLVAVFKTYPEMLNSLLALTVLMLAGLGFLTWAVVKD